MAAFVCEGVEAPRQCIGCDQPFVPTRVDKTWCSRACYQKMPRKRYRPGRNRADRIKCRSFICEWCSVEFHPKRSGPARFCSRDCSFAAQKAAASKPKATIRLCRVCSCEVAPSRNVCDGCKAPAYKPIPRVQSSCIGCGNPIVGTAAKKKCRRCSRKAFVKKDRILRKARHRARYYGVEYEPIVPRKVFDRDGWRCQVCGIKTPKAKRGTYEANAPELDHRVPLSKGGGHVWSNVQCCCRSCNMRKGANLIVGQLNLFPNAA